MIASLPVYVINVHFGAEFGSKTSFPYNLTFSEYVDQLRSFCDILCLGLHAEQEKVNRYSAYPLEVHCSA